MTNGWFFTLILIGPLPALALLGAAGRPPSESPPDRREYGLLEGLTGRDGKEGR